MRTGSAFRRLVNRIKFAMLENKAHRGWAAWLGSVPSRFPKNGPAAYKQAQKELKRREETVKE